MKAPLQDFAESELYHAKKKRKRGHLAGNERTSPFETLGGIDKSTQA